MSIYEQFKTDKKAESEGVWIDYGNGAGFKVARMAKANKKYTKAMEFATRPYRRVMELGTMDEKVAEGIFLEVFLATILLDWRGITDESGKALEFNKKNAKKLFSDLPELYDDLSDQSKKLSLFKEQVHEEELKN